MRAAALVAALAAGPAGAEVRGVLAGVDAYAALPPLEGAAADARDLAGAVRALGGAPVTLTDAAATRAAFLAAVRAMAAAAQPGDLAVIGFAGHGLREPEATPGQEPDGLDETIAFAGFAPDGPGAGERLRDDELGALIAAFRPGVRVIVAVDACHGGAMSRAADPRGRPLATRAAPPVTLAADPLPPPPPGEAALAAPPEGALFLGAAQEHELAPEVLIDGRPRGALSWALARTLAGEAGVDPRRLTLAETAAHLRAQVRALSGGRQTPEILHAPASAGDALVPASAPPPGLALAAPPAGPAPRPAVWAPGVEGRLAALADALVPAASAGEADLMWDVAAGEVVDMATADMAAQADDLPGLRGAAVRWRAERELIRLPPGAAFALAVEPEAAVRRIGETVTLVLPRPAAPERLLIVNLAGDGRAQVVFPPPGAPAGSDVVAPGPAPLRLGPLAVVEPPGADRLAAIYCPCDLGPLARLAADPARGDALGFVRALAALAARAPVRVGQAALYATR